ncbi:hypothetical protein PHYSODRAFT_468186 [Phytophthora sojae]|uniref:Uncharacterized protein n=1 Tax=Phytophthora sojae (strain P6497) TaxID=1094619 RepID=G4YNT7_PHYSP|nr:hypothetical protein PHYSODRAFT_468186 [Phytophthora sojae]EGZ30645.1 hypothetical protein PHYSODRAFT_468186 [Phytophthora sojae]|eukprot:XP_009517920.1 hypothetical protein PHYSODRAFT_468186 [Phytophthora sojae]
MILLVFGRKPFERNSPCRQHLGRFLRFLIAFLALAVTSPFCKVVYDLVPVHYYAFAAVLLPVVGLAAEQFLIKATKELEVFIPTIIAFSVDLLTALFVSVCISASPPIHVSILFIGVDLAQLWLEYREVSAHANTVLEFIRKQQSSEGKNTGDNSAVRGKLLARMIAVTRNPKTFKLAWKNSVRLWACLPHPLARDQRDQLRVLEASRFEEYQKILSHRQESQPRKVTVTFKLEWQQSYRRTPSSGSTHSAPQGKPFIVEGLQLLFQCEYLVLVEYVECIIPVVFTVYKSILQQLPNVVFYPVGAGKWGVRSMGNTLALAALEAASLVLLHHLLHRKFGFSPFYQLGFVLETQIHMVQMRLFLEFVVLLQFELEHLGVDFTFRFEWLRGNS